MIFHNSKQIKAAFDLYWICNGSIVNYYFLAVQNLNFNLKGSCHSQWL